MYKYPGGIRSYDQSPIFARGDRWTMPSGQLLQNHPFFKFQLWTVMGTKETEKFHSKSMNDAACTFTYMYVHVLCGTY
jgi:hypothetical protein